MPLFFCMPRVTRMKRPMSQLICVVLAGGAWQPSSRLRSLDEAGILQGEELIVNEDEPAMPAHVQHAKPPPAETPGAPGEHWLTNPVVATGSWASFRQCSTAFTSC